MIDNVKFWIPQKEILENHINRTRVIDLSTKLELLSGLVTDCPMKGKYFNMDVVLTCKSAFIKGSIHMMTNLLKGKGKQNYNDLTFCSASESITHLIEIFGINQKTSLTNLEFGLNIGLSQDPQQILDYNLLMYDSEAHSKNLTFRGKGNYKEFHKTDYYIKIYNKSKQYGLKSNILRIEVKIILKRKLQKLGIFSIEDLQKEEVIKRLYSFLWEELQKLTIIDDYTNVKMSLEDQNSLNEYTNPNYWKKLDRDKSNKVKNNRRQKLKTLIIKYGLNTIQKEILTRLSEKFSEMTDCKPHNHKIAV